MRAEDPINVRNKAENLKIYIKLHTLIIFATLKFVIISKLNYPKMRRGRKKTGGAGMEWTVTKML